MLSDAVGTIITDRSPHRTVRARLRIRLPPWMSHLGFDEACPKTIFKPFFTTDGELVTFAPGALVAPPNKRGVTGVTPCTMPCRIAWPDWLEVLRGRFRVLAWIDGAQVQMHKPLS